MCQLTFNNMQIRIVFTVMNLNHSDLSFEYYFMKDTFFATLSTSPHRTSQGRGAVIIIVHSCYTVLAKSCCFVVIPCATIGYIKAPYGTFLHVAHFFSWLLTFSSTQVLFLFDYTPIV